MKNYLPAILRWLARAVSLLVCLASGFFFLLLMTWPFGSGPSTGYLLYTAAVLIIVPVTAMIAGWFRPLLGAAAYGLILVMLAALVVYKMTHGEAGNWAVPLMLLTPPLVAGALFLFSALADKKVQSDNESRETDAAS